MEQSKVHETSHDDAVGLLHALMHAEEWINRRIESARIDRDGEARTSHSLDISPHRSQLPIIEDGLVTPVGLFTRDALRKVDTAAEDGRTLPILTTEQTSRLVARMLTTLLLPAHDPEVILEAGIEERLIDYLSGAPGRYDEFHSWFVSLPLALRSADDTKLTPDSTRSLFFFMCERFDQHFLLLLHLPKDLADRRTVVKIGYADATIARADTSTSGSKRIEFPLTYARELTSPGLGASYHYEMELPPEVDFRSIWLTEIRGNGSRRVLSKRRDFPPAESLAHIHQQFESFFSRGHAYVELVPQTSGMPNFARGAAILTAITIFCICIVGALRITTHQPPGDFSNVIAILLVLPTPLLGWVALPNEHQLVTEMLRPFRAAIRWSSATLIAGAVLIALSPGADSSIRGWTLLLIFQLWVTLEATEAYARASDSRYSRISDSAGGSHDG